MRDLLYLLAVILIIGWAIGVFFYSLGGLIHILLVIAVIAILLRLIGGKGVQECLQSASISRPPIGIASIYYSDSLMNGVALLN